VYLPFLPEVSWIVDFVELLNVPYPCEIQRMKCTLYHPVVDFACLSNKNMADALARVPTLYLQGDL
jgi:hypothetical protein